MKARILQQSKKRKTLCRLSITIWMAGSIFAALLLYPNPLSEMTSFLLSLLGIALLNCFIGHVIHEYVYDLFRKRPANELFWGFILTACLVSLPYLVANALHNAQPHFVDFYWTDVASLSTGLVGIFSLWYVARLGRQGKIRFNADSLFLLGVALAFCLPVLGPLYLMTNVLHNAQPHFLRFYWIDVALFSTILAGIFSAWSVGHLDGQGKKSFNTDILLLVGTTLTFCLPVLGPLLIFAVLSILGTIIHSCTPY